ncbi:MAG: VWA domain-containing protein, partial [Pseudomonadota bacterium]
VAILMTDGEYNTVSGTGCNSSTAVTSGNFATDTCAAMKAKGIIVYTVGFELTATSAIDVMNSCATDSGKAYLAENGAQLQAAFKDIADSINRLRLTS